MPEILLDSDDEVDGAAIETLVFECLRAENANHNLGYQLFYWRTMSGAEVDFVLYGERGLHAFEVKRSSVFRESDLDGLRLFCADYPVAKGHLFYGGSKRYRFDGIDVVPHWGRRSWRPHGCISRLLTDSTAPRGAKRVDAIMILLNHPDTTRVLPFIMAR